ncbi:NUDIX hydrolase [Aquicoccus porphyridii]|uniref:NUDIX hydrolase n=2 Tax=Aquicoccus porphyridii TaxID=1852029 RepID=A0A5A9ZGM7_9RHOB|nr:NUDIX hydrolase [Aquicoccus porphyridii]KAA0916310.1 NUDIX hydrolase [Aquicoccus porphyridii]RAI53563.1 NUDIX hydrolase [Rhodobacteraceae bacterium AsT-22]
MTAGLRRAWTEMVRPLFKRPNRLQVAALCYRQGDDGKEVLLVTSRDTGRWIIPKGWPINGKDAPGAALQEAWEEAGVRTGQVTGKAIGTYCYEKELSSGLPVPVETLVFPVEVRKLEGDYPEAHERRRKWVSPARAANMVREPELQQILRDM